MIKINDEEIMLKLKDVVKEASEVALPQLSNKSSDLSQAHPSSNQIIVKEMFLHTRMKIYPDGSIYLEIKGRPKDVEYKHPPKKAVVIPEKLDKYVKKDGVKLM